MGEKIFQKSASAPRTVRNDTLVKSGILDPQSFDKYCKLTAYKPTDSLRPFVSHYWIIRWDVPDGQLYRPVEVLSQPVVNLFFTANEAFVYGLINTTFEYEAYGKGTMAGVTFTPGGFYPYWGKSMASLPKGRIAAADFLPVANAVYSASLVAQDDEGIVEQLDALLLTIHPQPSANLELIGAIVRSVTNNAEAVNVAAIAKQFQMRERTLQHLFQTEVGVTLQWLILRTRLLAAAAEAQKTARPNWAQLAADLGYSSQAHFSADFRRVVGYTPAKFKNLSS